MINKDRGRKDHYLKYNLSRRRYRDSANGATINRIGSVFDLGQNILWHRRCYAVYTDKGKIQRMKTFFSVFESQSSNDGEGRTSHMTQRYSRKHLHQLIGACVYFVRQKNEDYVSLLLSGYDI